MSLFCTNVRMKYHTYLSRTNQLSCLDSSKALTKKTMAKTIS